MDYVNDVTLVGRAARKELRYTNSGTALLKGSIIVADEKDTDWYFPIIIWGEDAEKYNDRINEGDHILVEGKLTINLWTDRNKQKRSDIQIKVIHFELADQGGGGGTDDEIPY